MRTTKKLKILMVILGVSQLSLARADYPELTADMSTSAINGYSILAGNITATDTIINNSGTNLPDSLSFYVSWFLVQTSQGCNPANLIPNFDESAKTTYFLTKTQVNTGISANKSIQVSLPGSHGVELAHLSYSDGPLPTHKNYCLIEKIDSSGAITELNKQNNLFLVPMLSGGNTDDSFTYTGGPYLPDLTLIKSHSTLYTYDPVSTNLVGTVIAQNNSSIPDYHSLTINWYITPMPSAKICSIDAIGGLAILKSTSTLINTNTLSSGLSENEVSDQVSSKTFLPNIYTNGFGYLGAGYYCFWVQISDPNITESNTDNNYLVFSQAVPFKVAPIIMTSGIDEPLLSEYKVRAYPNPATDHLTIDLPPFSGGDPTYVSLYDEQKGTQIFSKRVPAGNLIDQEDLSTLPKGIYSLILVKNGQEFSTRIIHY